MELITIATLPPPMTTDLLRALRNAQDTNSQLTTFNNLPTAMLFAPTAQYGASLHYMFFPAIARQRFHYHPRPRYLLLLGDTSVHVHYSAVPVTANPHQSARTLTIPPFVLSALRFEGNFWHAFETTGDAAIGVVAFSFHDNDQVTDLSTVSDHLMEELTTFWDSND